MKLLLILFIFFLCLLILLGAEIFFALRGKKIQSQNPSPTPVTFGTTGDKLTYLVLGDSILAGVGGDYTKGVAVSTAKFLAQKNQITLINTSVSGATTRDVLEKQLKTAGDIKPDVVLIVIGSNDVTHLTAIPSIKQNLSKILDVLLAKNCKAKIILTGAGAVGSSPRFIPPLSWLTSFRVNQVNKVFTDTVKQRNFTFAPVAEKTGAIFLKDRTLFASDKFHPNDKGYVLWTNVINTALLDAGENQPSHCKN